jgi:hypothetical protein
MGVSSDDRVRAEHFWEDQPLNRANHSKWSPAMRIKMSYVTTRLAAGLPRRRSPHQWLWPILLPLSPAPTWARVESNARRPATVRTTPSLMIKTPDLPYGARHLPLTTVLRVRRLGRAPRAVGRAGPRAGRDESAELRETRKLVKLLEHEVMRGAMGYLSQQNRRVLHRLADEKRR